jgi:hypothetical protein
MTCATVPFAIVCSFYELVFSPYLPSADPGYFLRRVLRGIGKSKIGIGGVLAVWCDRCRSPLLASLMFYADISL